MGPKIILGVKESVQKMFGYKIWVKTKCQIQNLKRLKYEARSISLWYSKPLTSGSRKTHAYSLVAPLFSIFFDLYFAYSSYIWTRNNSMERYTKKTKFVKVQFKYSNMLLLILFAFFHKLEFANLAHFLFHFKIQDTYILQR